MMKMFKHTVNYVDFNGTEREEELYFHLSLPEVTRLEAEIGKPLDQYTKDLVANQDMKNLLDFLEKVLLNSYGRKTSDGRSFHKSKELRSEFEYSQAYAEVFEQLLTNPELAQKFGAAVSDNGKAKKNQVAPTVVNN
jgi:hypothetical protein